MWVYRKRREGQSYLYTTGYFTPSGQWVPDEDFNDKEQAVKRVNYMNGGSIINIKADNLVLAENKNWS